MLNCPACGAESHKDLRYTKLMVCEYCHTTLFIEDEAVKHAGEKSVIVDTPSIFTLGRQYRYRGMTFEPIGRVQFDYGDGNGYWDEWWVQTGRGKGKWISVDEGDIAIETLVEEPVKLPACRDLKIDQSLTLFNQSLLVTETGKATCVALDGRLPEVITPGEVHHYVHLSGRRAALFTLECCGIEKQLFKGSWVDPFDIEVLGHG